MENKTTTELLNLLKTLIDKDGKITDTDKYETAEEELYFREPFFALLHKDSETSIYSLLERIEALEEEIKKLKRHKHNKKNDDVLIRI